MNTITASQIKGYAKLSIDWGFPKLCTATTQLTSFANTAFKWGFPKLCTGVVLTVATIAALISIFLDFVDFYGNFDTLAEFPIETPIVQYPTQATVESPLKGQFTSLGDWVPMTKKKKPSKSLPAIKKAYQLAVTNAVVFYPS